MIPARVHSITFRVRCQVRDKVQFSTVAGAIGLLKAMAMAEARSPIVIS